jgi:tRNA threonylcarbamoyladenosine biosynthesis protein TsaB
VIVLALDTALAATSVAVLDGEKVLATRSEPMERGHQERLAGIVRDTMDEAKIDFEALDRIGVTVGPGSFTGLRVGLAFAKGLALALDIPCIGVGTLEALAASVRAVGPVVAAIDARRGQVYLQIFRNGAALTAPEALTIENAKARLDQVGAGASTLVGSGGPLLRSEDTLINVYFADPVALARLAANVLEPIARPAPLYLRAPDAKTIAERAAAPG